MSSVARLPIVLARDHAGSDRSAWTYRDVERWLKAGSAAMLHTAILAPGGSTLRAVNGPTPSATFDIIAFTGTVLGERSIERLTLLVWAREGDEGRDGRVDRTVLHRAGMEPVDLRGTSPARLRARHRREERRRCVSPSENDILTCVKPPFDHSP